MPLFQLIEIYVLIHGRIAWFCKQNAMHTMRQTDVISFLCLLLIYNDVLYGRVRRVLINSKTQHTQVNERGVVTMQVETQYVITLISIIVLIIYNPFNNLFYFKMQKCFWQKYKFRYDQISWFICYNKRTYLVTDGQNKIFRRTIYVQFNVREKYGVTNKFSSKRERLSR